MNVIVLLSYNSALRQLLALIFLSFRSADSLFFKFYFILFLAGTLGGLSLGLELLRKKLKVLLKQYRFQF